MEENNENKRPPLSKEDCWKIINKKVTIVEAMNMFTSDRAEIEKTKEIIGGSLDAYFSLANLFAATACMRLIELKEIDESRIFNLASAKYDTDDDGKENRVGDIGIINGEMCRYTSKGWEEMRIKKDTV